MSFEFNALELKRFMENEVQSAINDLAQQKTLELEQLSHQYAGRKPEEIKPALQQLFDNHGGSITDPELSDWAQLISDGKQIEMIAEKIDWK